MSALLVDIALTPDADLGQGPPPPGSSLDVLARTLWGETRSESLRAKEALAALVVNRLRHAEAMGGRYWWGNSINEICRRPGQFPCWSKPCRLLTVTMEDRAFRVAVRTARRAMAGILADPTGGATHWHRQTELPPWTRGRFPMAEIGPFLFYANVE
ncbi:putative Cell wall hydrolyse [Magnetospirillum sp. LM-5]|uniref:cell wall hydrolase n=1 Tax=Magnetospirillum sp. LM-5 TaxID=2681466 RepID=UPI0013808691|nr:cell wall hydrolase [Magnetospirillum sp. LM-5]CAA7619524.1 putative Cell wall hydrolyse [Magnetospirillum sp. LM-5]